MPNICKINNFNAGISNLYLIFILMLFGSIFPASGFAEAVQRNGRLADFVGNAQIIAGKRASEFQIVFSNVDQLKLKVAKDAPLNVPLATGSETKVRELVNKNAKSQVLMVIGNSVETGELYRVQVENASFMNKQLFYKIHLVEDITGKNGITSIAKESHRQNKIILYAIADCSDGPTPCYGAFQNEGQSICQVECGDLGITVGYCFGWSGCTPCNDYSAQCNAPASSGGVCNSSSFGSLCMGNCTDTQGCFGEGSMKNKTLQKTNDKK